MTVKHLFSYTSKLTLQAGGSTGTGYIGLTLTEPKTWKNIFATTNASGETSKTLLSKLQISLLFSVDTQPAPVTYNMFLVSMKRGSQITNMNSLTDDVAFSTMPAGNPEACQNIFLNEKIFKIHRRRPFTLAQLPDGNSSVDKGGDPPCSW